MTDIVVVGAGGRAGRAVVAEARRRGSKVAAVVREPSRHAGMAGPEVRLVRGDVTDADGLAAVTGGAAAVVHAAADLTADPGIFFPAAARALGDALGRTGVRRLVVVGLASVLPDAAGRPLMETPGYPQEYRVFYEGHGAGVAALRRDLDWLVVSPAGDFDHAGGRTGRYEVAPADAASRISYADLAVAVVDEIETPTRHRVHIGVRWPAW
jgi:uncharacterized protein